MYAPILVARPPTCATSAARPTAAGPSSKKAMRLVDEHCKHQTMVGWVKLDDWAKSYGREVTGERICKTISSG
ncbi:hypothetical protein PG994_004043 [Apiospora phragmitis]|uniref:Uncharacterized protein n=1 Tax=Apiospora phragmitis TaxID=2905665 RepID=A0ABR1VZT7_9PEZI